MTKKEQRDYERFLEKFFYSVDNLDGEVWRDLEEYPLYAVSDYGRIKKCKYEICVLRGNGICTTRFHQEQIIKPILGKNGYYKVNLPDQNGKWHTVNVHRLVGDAFLPNPDNLPYINHKSENKLDNRLINLERVTPKANANYGTRNQRLSESKKGVKRGALSEAHKKAISQSCIKNAVNGKKVICDTKIFRSAREAADYFGVQVQTMRKCLNGISPMPEYLKDIHLRYAGSDGESK